MLPRLSSFGFDNPFSSVFELLASTSLGNPLGPIVAGLLGQSNIRGQAPYDSLGLHASHIYQWSRPSFDGTASEQVVSANINGHSLLSHVDGNNTHMSLDITLSEKLTARYPGRPIIFVPCGRGGTGWDNGWLVGGDPTWGTGDGYLYDDAVRRINACMAANPGATFVGFFWHQGERSVAQNVPAATHRANLLDLVDNLRIDVTAAGPTTPFILGGMTPAYVAAQGAQGAAIAEVLETLPNYRPYVAFWSSELPTPLTDIDTLHFDAAGYRGAGERAGDALPVAIAAAPAPPDAPENFRGTPGDGEVELFLDPPIYTHGSVVTDYVWQYKIGAGSWTTLVDGVGLDESYTHTGLTNDVAVTYRAAAMNDTGQGDWTEELVFTPTASGVEPEAGAAGHWIFGTGNPTDADLVSGQTLTHSASPPTRESNHLSFDAVAEYSDTGIADADDVTICVVARLQTNSLQFQIAGNYLNNTNGIGICASNTYHKAFARSSGGGVNVTARTTDVWVFLALSVDGDGDKIGYVGDAGGAASVTFTEGRTNVQAANIGLGNIQQATGMNDTTCDVAELIVFHGAKTVAELDAIYAASVARMSDQSITVE